MTQIRSFIQIIAVIFAWKVTNDGSLAKSQKEEIFSCAFQLLWNCFYLLALCLFIFLCTTEELYSSDTCSSYYWLHSLVIEEFKVLLRLHTLQTALNRKLSQMSDRNNNIVLYRHNVWSIWNRLQSAGRHFHRLLNNVWIKPALYRLYPIKHSLTGSVTFIKVFKHGLECQHSHDLQSVTFSFILGLHNLPSDETKGKRKWAIKFGLSPLMSYIRG